MKRTKQEKGITLIALIITIIVLLILAVVAIRAIQGDGIIIHAKKATSDYEQKQIEEKERLEDYLYEIEGNTTLNHSGTIPQGGVYKHYEGDASSLVCEICKRSPGSTGIYCDCGSISIYDLPSVEYRSGDAFPDTVSPR